MQIRFQIYVHILLHMDGTYFVDKSAIISPWHADRKIQNSGYFVE